MEPIVVTTPTGNIGSKIVADLIARGETVHVIARYPEKLPDAVREKVIVHQGDQFDEAFMTKVTQGASALFWLTPPQFDSSDARGVYQRSANVAQAVVSANRIPHVVHLSSAGAQNENYGLISLVKQVEDALNATGANVVHLRPGWFFVNFLSQVQPMKNAGAIFLPIPPERKLEMVATADIADVATEYLATRTFSGTTYRGIHGPADLSMVAAAEQIGAGVGREIGYVQITPEQARENLRKAGASENVADKYVEMLVALAEQGAKSAEPRTPETTTPTTLADWAAQTIKPMLAG